MYLLLGGQLLDVYVVRFLRYLPRRHVRDLWLVELLGLSGGHVLSGWGGELHCLPRWIFRAREVGGELHASSCRLICELDGPGGVDFDPGRLLRDHQRTNDLLHQRVCDWNLKRERLDNMHSMSSRKLRRSG